MSAGKRKRRRPAPTEPDRAAPDTDVEQEPEPARGGGLLGSTLFASGDSALPPLGRSVGRGLVAVFSQPVLVATTIVLVAASWFGLLALGFEGVPTRLADVLAMSPVSTFFDLGTGAALYGTGPGFLVFVGVSIALRGVVTALLTGMILEALEDGRVTRYGVLRGVAALPTALVVQVAAFSLIVAGNLVLPVLGPGLGFLGFVSALVGGLFFLGFAPIAAIREGRTVMETIRRSARAAMLPRGRHLVLCSLYFLLALPVAVGLAPGGTEITANPSVLTWVFVLVANVFHLGFVAAFAYRWIVAEPHVPEQPVRRRPAPRAQPVRGRRR
jgi:hypothetical protein